MAGAAVGTRVAKTSVEPPWIVVGTHGDAVIRVLEVGRSLTEPTARRLASARDPEADSASSWSGTGGCPGQPNASAYQRQITPGPWR